MPKLKDGTYKNSGYHGQKKYSRIRVSAGPHRDEYVDTLILEAKLGRKLLPGMTVEHIDGNPLNFGDCGNNLKEVTRAENTILMNARRHFKGMQ